MERLRAKRPVLYQGRMYNPGEALPASDTKMVAAWLEAGSAEMIPLPTADPPAPPENGHTAPPENDQPAQMENDPPAPPENDLPMVEGHLDPDQLAKWSKADLEKLASDMGVDISGAKNNAERAALIAAVPVQAPANENGGAQ